VSERPCVAYEANDCGYYAQSEADALFESLEAELQVTKRALELAAAYTDVDSFYFMKKAREERG
jgi:hypothetical protein